MSITPCVAAPITTGIVVFEPAAFIAAYPAFALIPTAVLEASFALATTMLNNACGSRIQDATQRELLLNLLVAHITYLTSGTAPASGAATPAPALIGRITSATEGSVSVGADYGGVIGTSEAYFLQSQWGALFYQLTARYRTALYLAPARANCGPFSLAGLGSGFGLDLRKF